MSKTTVPITSTVSRKAAIEAFCWNCMGGCPVDDPQDIRETRKDIHNCSSVDCALLPFRPYQRPENKLEVNINGAAVES